MTNPLGVKAVMVSVQMACLLGAAACARLPSDEQLLEDFRQHRDELHRLVRMFEEDKGLARVGANFTRPHDPARVGVLAERIRQYRRLCEAATAMDCIEGYDATYERLEGGALAVRSEKKDPIWIHMRSGLAISGASKGFLYSADPPFEVVADLDQVVPHDSGTWIRHIEGAWYIFVAYED